MKKFILTLAIALPAFSAWAQNITLPRDNNGVPYWTPMRVTDGTDKTRFAIVDSQGRLVVFSASTTVGGTVDARQSGLWTVAVYQVSSPFNVQQGTNPWVIFLNTTTVFQGTNFVVNYGTVPFSTFVATAIVVHPPGGAGASFQMAFSTQPRVSAEQFGSWITGVYWSSTTFQMAFSTRGVVEGYGTFQTASTGTTVFPSASAIPVVSTTTQSVSQSQNWTVIQGTGDFRMVNGSAPFNATITSITVPIEISSGGVVIKGSVVVLLSSGGVFGIGNFKVVADSQTFSANISSQQIQVLGVVPVSGSSITIVVLGQITINSSSPTASVTAFQAPNSTYAVSGNMNVSTNTPAAVNYSIYESTSITISTAAFIFSGSGFIGEITVIRAGVGSALTVYDSSSGATGHILVNDADTSLDRTISVRSAVTNGLVIDNSGATPAKIHVNFIRKP